MEHHKIILEDLKKYLEGKEIASKVEFYRGEGKWKLIVELKYRRSYSIKENQIYSTLYSEFVAPLADPGYKRKLYEYIEAQII